jgi:hypothetical protein
MTGSRSIGRARRLVSSPGDGTTLIEGQANESAPLALSV